MKPVVASFLAIAIVAAAAGVVVRARMIGTAARLDHIAKGMPKADAVVALGNPVRAEVDDAGEHLTYRFLKSPFDVKPSHYFVVLVGGRVSSFGELVVMAR